MDALRRARVFGRAGLFIVYLTMGCSTGQIEDIGGSGGTDHGGNDPGTGGGAGVSTAGGTRSGGGTGGQGGGSSVGGSQSGGSGVNGGSGGMQQDAAASDTGGAGRADASAGAGGNRPDSGAAGAGGGSLAPLCLNDRMDGNETGVDCGGSCPACPNYLINAPNRNNGAQSACQGGPGYMCARSMVFSPEFKQAAKDDWNSPDPPFDYGAAGHDADVGGLDSGANACCQCYQLIFESPIGVTGIPIPKPMIVQAFNTAAGGGKNFDIYMAAGGFGANNGCTAGNAMYSSFPNLGGDFTGGVRATRYPQCSVNNNTQFTLASISTASCQNFVASQCALIQSTASAQNQTTSQSSCLETNFPESHYHINWNVRAKRVECPVNLTRVTGCKLNPQGLPQANPAARNVATADGTFLTGYGTTTMQDCCRPSCAFPGSVANADPTWSVFYTCDKAGTPQ